MPGRQFSLSSYRYGFNGKEEDDEVKGNGNSLDFGARIYDSRLGRWFKCDEDEAESPSWTPYRFGFNNPIRISDPNGRFEIDEATAAAYPRFAAMLQNLQKTYQDKPEAFRKAFKKYSELSDVQISKLLEYKVVKNGTPIKPNQETPRIIIKDLTSLKANGVTKIYGDKDQDGNLQNAYTAGSIVINKSLVEKYEALENKKSEDPDRFNQNVLLEAAKLDLESTVFHEGTHYGDALNGILDKTNNSKEGGKMFENDAYGLDLGNLDKDGNSVAENYVRSNNINNASVKDKFANVLNFKPIAEPARIDAIDDVKK